MATHPDPSTLYSLCCSSQSADLHQGFQQLGEILLPVARGQLNPAQFDLAVVQDCVQQALFTIWQKIQEERGPRQPESFIQWSISIVVFKCIDRARHSERHATLALDGLTDETPLPPRAGGPSDAVLPEEIVVLNDEKIQLLLSLRNHPALSEESKQILIEGFLFETSDDELATRLSHPKGTVYVIRSRNLQKLRTDQAWIAKLQA